MSLDKIIKQWMIDSELYYDVEAMDVTSLEKYKAKFSSKLPELYRHLRELDKIPTNSYAQFSKLVMDAMNSRITQAIFQ